MYGEPITYFSTIHVKKIILPKTHVSFIKKLFHHVKSSSMMLEWKENKFKYIGIRFNTHVVRHSSKLIDYTTTSNPRTVTGRL